MPSIRRKLQITLEESTYEQLLRHIGARRRSEYIESLIIDHLMIGDTARSFRALAIGERVEAGLPPCSRGQVWEVAGSANGQGVIVSADVVNQTLDRVQLIPLVEPALRAEGARLSVGVGLRRYHAAPDRLATVLRSSLREPQGVLSATDVGAIEAALRTQLALWKG